MKDGEAIPPDLPVVGTFLRRVFHMCMKFNGIPRIPKIPTMKLIRPTLVCAEAFEIGISRLVMKIDDSHHEYVDV